MRHYVVVFLESRLFPGTWVTDHFVREEPREDIPKLPEDLLSNTHKVAVERLDVWQERLPGVSTIASWTLEELILGRVAVLTALWYSVSGLPQRLVEYTLSPALDLSS